MEKVYVAVIEDNRKVPVYISCAFLNYDKAAKQCQMIYNRVYAKRNSFFWRIMELDVK